MGVNSMPKTVARQRRGCDLNQGSSAPESSTLTEPRPCVGSNTAIVRSNLAKGRIAVIEPVAAASATYMQKTEKSSLAAHKSVQCGPVVVMERVQPTVAINL